MNWKCTWLKILLLCSISLSSAAQKNFIEGSITYSVRIESTSPKQTKQMATGSLNLFLKGNVVVKELELSSGFRNTMIFNGNEKAAYALRTIGGEHYALQLDQAQQKKKQEKCAQLTTEDMPGDLKSIANFKAEKTSIKCNNMPPLVVYFTKDWRISNQDLFEDFPSFSYLPLAYDIKNEDGSIFHFELQKIEAKPMDNSSFKIPEEYKIIGYEEFKSWQR